ncbi:MAG TPA: TolC family protein [Bacteroidia bacterium]
MFRSLVMATLCLTGLSLSGQTSKYTLKQCIEYAWLNNPDVKQSILNFESAKIDAKQSRTALLPSFSASAGQNYQFGRTIDRFTNTFVNQTIRSNNVSINGNWVVFNGLQNQNSIKRQDALERSNDESIQNTKNTIALSIASSFLQVIQAEETIKNCEFQIESTKQRIDRAQRQVDAGTTDLSALLSLKAQLANEQLNLVNAQNSKNTALLSLKNTMQMPIDNELDIEIPAVDPALISNDLSAHQIYLLALDNMPQIKAAVHQSEAARFQTKMSAGNYAPSIALYGSISTVYSQSAKEVTDVKLTGSQPIGYTQVGNEVVLQPVYSVNYKTTNFGKQFKDNLGQSLGLSLSWNLFNGMQVHNQVQKSKIQEQISALNLQRTKNTLMSDINLAVNNYGASKAKHEASVNNVDAQKLSFEYVQKRFDAGVTTSFDFIQAKNNYLQAVSSEVQARYELVFRGLILEFYKGNPITL